jgi:hypothetical protein
MPYEVIWEPRGVLKRYFGHVSKADHADSTQELFGDPRFDRVRYVINDFTAADSHSIDDEEIIAYTAGRIGCATYQPDIHGVFVANSPEMVALCKLMSDPQYEIPHETRIFSTLADGRNWLKSQRIS